MGGLHTTCSVVADISGPVTIDICSTRTLSHECNSILALLCSDARSDACCVATHTQRCLPGAPTYEICMRA